RFQIFKPGELQVDFDSATAYINEAKALNKALNSSAAYGCLLLTESILIKEKGNKDEAKKMVENAVSILESGGNKDYLGRAYYELSMYYDYNDDAQLDKKIELVKKSINDFEQAGDLKMKATALEMLGDLYVNKADFQSAITVLTHALI